MEYSIVDAAPSIGLDTPSVNLINNNNSKNSNSIEIKENEKVNNIQKQAINKRNDEETKLLECIEEIIKSTNSINNEEDDDKSNNNNIQDNYIIENKNINIKKNEKKNNIKQFDESNLQPYSDKNLRFKKEKENESDKNLQGKKKSKTLSQKNKKYSITVNPNLRNDDIENENDIIYMGDEVTYINKNDDTLKMENNNGGIIEKDNKINKKTNKDPCFIRCLNICFTPINFCCNNIFYYLCCCCCFKNIKNNSYGLSLLMIFIRNLIFLVVFLFLLIEKESFYFQFIIPTEIFFIGCLFGGSFFLLTKIIEFKTDSYDLTSPIILWIGISVFKGIFYFGIWSILNDNNYITIKYHPFIFNEYFQINATKVYIIYFSFLIIYFFTLSICLFLDSKGSYFIVFSLGVIYTGIAIIIAFVIWHNILIYVLIVCSSGFMLFNIAFGICYCKDVINNMNFAWNTLLIEINSLYPILAIFSIPTIIITAIYYCICAICCKINEFD